MRNLGRFTGPQDDIPVERIETGQQRLARVDAIVMAARIALAVALLIGWSIIDGINAL